MPKINGYQRPVFASYPSPMERRRPVTSEKQAPKKFVLSWDPSKIVKYMALGFVMCGFSKVSAQNPEKTCAATQKPQIQKPQFICILENHKYFNQSISTILMHDKFIKDIKAGRISLINVEDLPKPGTPDCIIKPLKYLANLAGDSFNKNSYYSKFSLPPDKIPVKICRLDKPRISLAKEVRKHGELALELTEELAKLQKDYQSGTLEKYPLKKLHNKALDIRKLCITYQNGEATVLKKCLGRNDDFITSMENYYQTETTNFVIMGNLHHIIDKRIQDKCLENHYIPEHTKLLTAEIIKHLKKAHEFCKIMPKTEKAKSVSDFMKIYKELENI